MATRRSTRSTAAAIASSHPSGSTAQANSTALKVGISDETREPASKRRKVRSGEDGVATMDKGGTAGVPVVEPIEASWTDVGKPYGITGDRGELQGQATVSGSGTRCSKRPRRQSPLKKSFVSIQDDRPVGPYQELIDAPQTGGPDQGVMGSNGYDHRAHDGAGIAAEASYRSSEIAQPTGSVGHQGTAFELDPALFEAAGPSSSTAAIPPKETPYRPPYPIGLTPFRYPCLHPDIPPPPPGDPANPHFRAFVPYPSANTPSGIERHLHSHLKDVTANTDGHGPGPLDTEAQSSRFGGMNNRMDRYGSPTEARDKVVGAGAAGTAGMVTWDGGGDAGHGDARMLDGQGHAAIPGATSTDFIAGTVQTHDDRDRAEAGNGDAHGHGSSHHVASQQYVEPETLATATQHDPLTQIPDQGAEPARIDSARQTGYDEGIINIGHGHEYDGSTAAPAYGMDIFDPAAFETIQQWLDGTHGDAGVQVAGDQTGGENGAA